METARYDVAVIGGGIIGLATARVLLERFPKYKLLLLEKESSLASHQTEHNSGVIHSGVYYRPGSLKARLCVTGAQRLTAFCDVRSIPYRRCGKVIVAAEPKELPILETLYLRGIANGVPGLAQIGPDRLQELEPHVRGIQALYIPGVAVVDFAVVANALAGDIERLGGTVLTSTRMTKARQEPKAWNLCTTRGNYQAHFLINCGGLHVDRLARMAGDQSSVRIIPFRGEYYALPPSRASLVNGLIYPVPEPSMPFLGIHFTKTLDGAVNVGPNAVLALKREGYRGTDFSWQDCFELAASPGFWRMIRRYWKAGMKECIRSFSKGALLRCAQRLVPALKMSDLLPSLSGVRAQAVDRDGSLLDDFAIRQSKGALHIYNAPSPAATASLSIAEIIVERFTKC